MSTLISSQSRNEYLPRRNPKPLFHKPGPQASLPCGRAVSGTAVPSRRGAIGLRARCFWRLQEFRLGSWIWIWRCLALQESEVGFKGLAVTIPSPFFCKNGLRSLCPHHPPRSGRSAEADGSLCGGLKRWHEGMVHLSCLWASGLRLSQFSTLASLGNGIRKRCQGWIPEAARPSACHRKANRKKNTGRIWRWLMRVFPHSSFVVFCGEVDQVRRDIPSSSPGEQARHLKSDLRQRCIVPLAKMTV